MSPASMKAGSERELFASYATPLLLFLCLTLLLQVADVALLWEHPSAPWWRQAPEMLIYPLQTIVCAAYLWYTRKGVCWDWAWKSSLLGLLAGLVGIALWLVPYFTGWVDASEGFNPAKVFGEGSAMSMVQYGMRIMRAVIIVPMVEEFFWRGYLMRWAIDPDAPEKVPMGSGSWKAYLFSTVGFMLVHHPQDYAGAFLFGTIAYWLTVRTKRMSAVVLMHAIANLIMCYCALRMGLPGLL